MGKLNDISFIIVKRGYIMQTCTLEEAWAFLKPDYTVLQVSSMLRQYMSRDISLPLSVRKVKSAKTLNEF